ncbi:hypothetical protein BC834DRAFT_847442 [Gloeopeniophorella convolvens]|nr:hypothetical protein BC834DRAFT_847442 [Gloeopeniophorella convolvens]
MSCFAVQFAPPAPEVTAPPKIAAGDRVILSGREARLRDGPAELEGVVKEVKGDRVWFTDERMKIPVMATMGELRQLKRPVPYEKPDVKHPTVGHEVAITKGNYKGYRGIMKTVSDDGPIIELEAKSTQHASSCQLVKWEHISTASEGESWLLRDELRALLDTRVFSFNVCDTEELFEGGEIVVEISRPRRPRAQVSVPPHLLNQWELATGCEGLVIQGEVGGMIGKVTKIDGDMCKIEIATVHPQPKIVRQLNVKDVVVVVYDARNIWANSRTACNEYRTDPGAPMAVSGSHLSEVRNQLTPLSATAGVPCGLRSLTISSASNNALTHLRSSLHAQDEQRLQHLPQVVTCRVPLFIVLPPTLITSPAPCWGTRRPLLHQREDNRLSFSTLGHVLYERGLDDEFDDYPLIKKMEVDEREVYLKLYNNIVCHIPGLREFMDANPPKVALESAMQKVDPPVQNTCSDHSSNLQSRILDYIPCAPQKSFGRDASFRTRWGAGNIIISELDLPLFLWKNYEYSSKDPYNGFLQSKVLKKAWMCIYFGPGAVDGAAQAVSNERGIAKKHHMTEVTPHSIAYTAVLVMHSLSSENRWEGKACSYLLKNVHTRIQNMITHAIRLSFIDQALILATVYMGAENYNNGETTRVS